MNIHEPLDAPSYAQRLWWVMLAGCAARFTAERSASEALTGFVFWAIVFSVCWMLRNAIRRGASSGPHGEKVGNVIAVAGMLLFLLKLNSDGLIPALLVFLFSIQAALFVVAEKRLHAWLIVSAAFAGLMFAAAESRSGMFLLCAAWLTFAMLGLLTFDQHLDRERYALLKALGARKQGSSAFFYGVLVLAVTVPVYLFVPKPAGLLLGGMQATTAHDYRDTADSAPPRTSDVSDAPRSEEWGGGPLEPKTQKDETRTANPTGGSYGESFSNADIQREDSNANGIVLFVKSSHNIYLRGNVYDRFENNRWTRESRPAQEYALVRGLLERKSAMAGTSNVRQTIEIVANLDRVLVHAPGLERLRFPGPSVRGYDDGVYEAPRPLLADTTYSAESSLEIRHGRYALRDAPLLNADRYLQISSDATERLRDLADRIAEQADDPLGKAMLLERHLRANYRYSYETIPQQGYTPLDWFLFDSQRGHCEYFASALAVMLRTQGIPSRVATGFSLGESNPLTGFYEVRALDGHAWVEAYIEGMGWLMFEPTPFYPLPDTQSQQDRQVAAATDRYLDRLAETSQALDPQSIKTRLILTARDAWAYSRHVLRQMTAVPRALGWATLYLMIAAVFLLIGGYLGLLLLADIQNNRSVRRNLARAETAELKNAALILADAVEAVNTPRGYFRKAHWTFREYVDHLAGTEHAVPHPFTDLFEASRYADVAPQNDSALLHQVAKTLDAAIQHNRWPRVRRALRQWRGTIMDWLPKYR